MQPSTQSCRWAVAILASLAGSATAFIPASPSSASPMSASGDSMQSTWPGTGFYRDPIFRLVQHNSSTGGTSDSVVKGALVHFTEQNSTVQPASLAPWIALIKCDSNGSTGSYSMERDIFSLAADHGARAVVLYSQQDGANSCAINPSFNNSSVFGQPTIDVWTLTMASASRNVQGYFDNLGGDSFAYNSALLNASASAISTALDTNATSNSANSTSGSPFVLSQILPGVRDDSPNMDPPGTGTTQQGSTGGGGGGPNTGLAMIILYAITGCVTFMFLIVICSGAIRAIRHPERYGPRARDPRNPHGNGGAQSRAGGIGRAILDTFPVVKFGRSEEAQPRGGQGEVEEGVTAEPKKDDLESGRGIGGAKTELVEMVALGGMENKRASTSTAEDEAAANVAGDAAGATSNASAALAGSFVESEAVAAAAKDVAAAPDETSLTPAAAVTVDPAAVDNKSTCPICVCDFEDGDDLRILPCTGKHVFHKDCIDPWLLDVSSLCPLCRWDFRREASGSEADGAPAVPGGAVGASESSVSLRSTPERVVTPEPMPTAGPSSPAAGSGFVNRILASRSGHGREATTQTTASVHQKRFAKYLAQVRLTGAIRRRAERVNQADLASYRASHG